jgi:hypothetical protein
VHRPVLEPLQAKHALWVRRRPVPVWPDNSDITVNCGGRSARRAQATPQVEFSSFRETGISRDFDRNSAARKFNRLAGKGRDPVKVRVCGLCRRDPCRSTKQPSPVDSADLPTMPGLAESQTGRRTRISTTKGNILVDSAGLRRGLCRRPAYPILLPNQTLSSSYPVDSGGTEQLYRTNIASNSLAGKVHGDRLGKAVPYP